MPRLRLAWLVAISLMAVGSLAAHSLAYRLAEPDAEARAATLAGTGHGYLAYAPFIVASALAVALCALAAVGVRAARGSGGTARASTWQLALLPPLGFVLQEHLERLGAGGDVAHLLGEPSFAVGLGLQVPFALAALAAARALVSAAVSLGRVLVPRPSASRRANAASSIPRGENLLPQQLAAVRGGLRGPPPRRVR